MRREVSVLLMKHFLGVWELDLLYKYVSAERALTCLPEIGDGTLRATQPSALNDPFECSVYKLFVEADEGRATAGCRRFSQASIHPTP